MAAQRKMDKHYLLVSSLTFPEQFVILHTLVVNIIKYHSHSSYISGKYNQISLVICLRFTVIYLSTIHHSSFIFVICKFYSSSSMHPVVRLSFICQQFIVRLLIFFTNHIFCHLINQCAPFYLYTSSSFIQSN